MGAGKRGIGAGIGVDQVAALTGGQRRLPAVEPAGGAVADDAASARRGEVGTEH
jgi:hypothetical protein